MRTLWIRTPIASAGLVVGLWLATTATPAREPVPAEISGATIDGDIAFLQTGLNKPNGRAPDAAAVPTLKATAMMIALYAQNNFSGPNADAMAALRAQALKVAEALAKKDYKAAASEADKLKTPPPSTDKTSLKLHAMHGFDLSHVMAAFRNGPNGRSLEKDIRRLSRDPSDAKLIGEVAARTALLGDYTLKLPNDKAAFSAANLKKWEASSAAMNGLAQELIEESAKGDKADKAVLKAKLAKLDGSCNACHNSYRSN